MVGSCYLVSMFRPINLSCRLLTLYYFPLHLFFGIRDINDAILLTLIVIRYPCMITCRVAWRYISTTIESNQVIPTVCMMTVCLPNRHEVHDSPAPTLNENESHCDLGNNTNRTLRYLNSSWGMYCIPCTAFKRVTVRETHRNKLLQLVQSGPRPSHFPALQHAFTLPKSLARLPEMCRLALLV